MNSFLAFWKKNQKRIVRCGTSMFILDVAQAIMIFSAAWLASDRVELGVLGCRIGGRGIGRRAICMKCVCFG